MTQRLCSLDTKIQKVVHIIMAVCSLALILPKVTTVKATTAGLVYAFIFKVFFWGNGTGNSEYVQYAAYVFFLVVQMEKKD